MDTSQFLYALSQYSTYHRLTRSALTNVRGEMTRLLAREDVTINRMRLDLFNRYHDEYFEVTKNLDNMLYSLSGELSKVARAAARDENRGKAALKAEENKLQVYTNKLTPIESTSKSPNPQSEPGTGVPLTISLPKGHTGELVPTPLLVTSKSPAPTPTVTPHLINYDGSHDATNANIVRLPQEMASKPSRIHVPLSISDIKDPLRDRDPLTGRTIDFEARLVGATQKIILDSLSGNGDKAPRRQRLINEALARRLAGVPDELPVDYDVNSMTLSELETRYGFAQSIESASRELATTPHTGVFPEADPALNPAACHGKESVWGSMVANFGDSTIPDFPSEAKPEPFRLVNRHQLGNEARRLAKTVALPNDYKDLLTGSPTMAEYYSVLASVESKQGFSGSLDTLAEEESEQAKASSSSGEGSVKVVTLSPPKNGTASTFQRDSNVEYETLADALKKYNKQPSYTVTIRNKPSVSSTQETKGDDQNQDEDLLSVENFEGTEASATESEYASEAGGCELGDQDASHNNPSSLTDPSARILKNLGVPPNDIPAILRGQQKSFTSSTETVVPDHRHTFAAPPQAAFNTYDNLSLQIPPSSDFKFSTAHLPQAPSFTYTHSNASAESNSNLNVDPANSSFQSTKSKAPSNIRTQSSFSSFSTGTGTPSPGKDSPRKDREHAHVRFQDFKEKTLHSPSAFEHFKFPPLSPGARIEAAFSLPNPPPQSASQLPTHRIQKLPNYQQYQTREKVDGIPSKPFQHPHAATVGLYPTAPIPIPGRPNIRQTLNPNLIPMHEQSALKSPQRSPLPSISQGSPLSQRFSQSVLPPQTQGSPIAQRFSQSLMPQPSTQGAQLPNKSPLSQSVQFVRPSRGAPVRIMNPKNGKMVIPPPIQIPRSTNPLNRAAVGEASNTKTDTTRQPETPTGGLSSHPSTPTTVSNNPKTPTSTWSHRSMTPTTLTRHPSTPTLSKIPETPTTLSQASQISQVPETPTSATSATFKRPGSRLVGGQGFADSSVWRREANLGSVSQSSVIDGLGGLTESIYAGENASLLGTQTGTGTGTGNENGNGNGSREEDGGEGKGGEGKGKQKEKDGEKEDDEKWNGKGFLADQSATFLNWD